jgi:hypothetical protein
VDADRLTELARVDADSALVSAAFAAAWAEAAELWALSAAVPDDRLTELARVLADTAWLAAVASVPATFDVINDVCSDSVFLSDPFIGFSP